MTGDVPLVGVVKSSECWGLWMQIFLCCISKRIHAGVVVRLEVLDDTTPPTKCFIAETFGQQQKCLSSKFAKTRHSNVAYSSSRCLPRAVL